MSFPKEMNRVILQSTLPSFLGQHQFQRVSFHQHERLLLLNCQHHFSLHLLLLVLNLAVLPSCVNRIILKRTKIGTFISCFTSFSIITFFGGTTGASLVASCFCFARRVIREKDKYLHIRRFLHGVFEVLNFVVWTTLDCLLFGVVRVSFSHQQALVVNNWRKR